MDPIVVAELEPEAPQPDRLARRGIDAWALAGFVAISQLAGLLGVAFTDRGADSWYDGLDKPAFTPPDGVFAPVWVTLYLVMAIAAWLVWRRRGAIGRIGALRMFFVQLALNAAWTPVFFGAQRPAIALAVIVALLVALVVTLVRFTQVHRLAGGLLVPYLAWVIFATALNAAIVAMN